MLSFASSSGSASVDREVSDPSRRARNIVVENGLANIDERAFDRVHNKSGCVTPRAVEVISE
jgi:hypothetical protein